jgi:photosystem II stability/assembly factor-like uncharacterized protein
MGRIVYMGLTPGSTAYVRVWKNGPGSGNFLIALAEFVPYINVNFPNGGEKLVVNEAYFLQWTSEGINYVDIDYSTDNGSTWNNIVTNHYNLTQNYIWTVPVLPSSQCLIRISETGNPATNDVSDAVFEIVYPYFELITPNGGEIFTVNQNATLEWLTYGDISYIDSIEISLDGGNTWSVMMSNFINMDYVTVTMPATPSTNCLFRISGNSTYGPASTTSAATFSIINTTPNISLHTPVKDGEYHASEGVLITWEADPVISFVDIEREVSSPLLVDNGSGNNISQRGGIYWEALATNVPAAQGFYYWDTDEITNNTTTKVRIMPVGSPWFAQESGDFDVYVYPYVEITYPSYFENWFVGSYKLITWNKAGVNAVNIEYSTSGNTGPWLPIASNVSSKSYYWQIPNTPSVNVYIKITDVNNPINYYISDYPLQITDLSPITNTLNVVYSGPLTLCPGSQFTINYNATGTFNFANLFHVQLSDVNGSFANPILIGALNSDFLSGTIDVQIPDNIPPGNGYRIRVVSDDNPSNTADNGQDISISVPDADFTVSSQHKYLPDGQVDFTFTGNTTGITTYNWSFGNGATSSSQNPSYIYTNRGYYTIALTTSNASCSKKVEKPMHIFVEDLFNNNIINTAGSGDFLSVRFLDGVKGCIGMDNGNCLITLDSGLTWQNTPTGLTTKLTSVSIVPGYWIVTSDSGMVSYSTNGGVTWTAVNIGTMENLKGSAFKTSGNGYVVGENGTIFKYDGTNWTQETTPVLHHLNSIAFSDDDVVAVGDNGTILRSPMGNGTWTVITSPYNSHLNAVTFNANYTGIAAGQYGRIIRSTDGGLTWSPVLPASYTWFKSVEMNVDSAWAVGTNGIIYQSMDEGLTWVRNGIGVPNNLNNIVFYGTEQRSILQANNPDYIFERAQAPNRGYIVGNGGTARIFGDPLIDTSSALNNILNFDVHFRVYPNPASEFINVSAELKNQANVIISVKDVFGRVIQSISLNTNAGILNKQIDISKLSCGYYFIDIIAANHQEIHRLVISR